MIIAITAICSLLMGLIIGTALGYWEAINRAVNAGKAEYYLDENNDKQWRWK